MKRLAVLLPALLLCACSSSPRIEDPAYDANKLAQLNVNMAIEYMREGKNDVALNRLGAALEYDPAYPPAHGTLGVLYARLGEDAKAERHFKEAVRRAPGDPSLLNNYGQFLCRDDRFEDGMALFDRALEDPLYNTPEVALTNAGLCARRAGDMETAEARFRKALQGQPRFAIALREMADIAFDKGEHLSARAYLQRYREVAPHTAETLWLGVQVERALGDLDTAASYALTLKSRFPDSDQAQQLRQSETE